MKGCVGLPVSGPSRCGLDCEFTKECTKGDVTAKIDNKATVVVALVLDRQSDWLPALL